MGRLLVTLSLLFLLAFFVGACNRADDSATAAGLHVTLSAAAEGVQGDYLRVKINDDEGRPVTDVTVGLEGNMTHAGMVPVLTESVWDGADGVEDGIYVVPFVFTMLGDWIITAKIERRDGEPLSEAFEATVTNETVVVK